MSDREKWQVDHALIAACRKGDSTAWERLIDRYRRLIYSIPVAFRIPEPDAQEIFQRVVVKLFENLGRLRRAESLPAWLGVTTRHECQSFLREKGRYAPDENRPAASDAVSPDIAEALVRTEREHTLALALERLDPTCRKLLAALYRDDPAPSYQQISRLLGRPIGSLGPTRMRCLSKLRRLYLELGGEEP